LKIIVCRDGEEQHQYKDILDDEHTNRKSSERILRLVFIREQLEHNDGAAKRKRYTDIDGGHMIES
jgi:hypothetical protein